MTCTPAEAWRIFREHFSPQVSSHQVPVSDALDCILAEEVLAPEDLPPFPRSMMDGFAVLARDTAGASPEQPIRLILVGEVPMGRAAELKLKPGECALVHTGGMIPSGSDAVVMIEHTRQPSPQAVEVLHPVIPGEHIIQPGEDVRRGQIVFHAGHQLRPQDLGGLLALGITQVTVARPPRVGILSQGDEVVPPEQTPGPGQVRDVNSYTLAALTRRAGGHPILLGIAPDRVETLIAMARHGWKTCDLLVISAGSSVSYRDMTAEVINALGRPGVLVHGISIRPGKPTILAVCDGKPVFGLPGNPVSAMVIFELFVSRVIREMMGAPIPFRRTVQARLAKDVPSVSGREDYAQVRLEQRDEEWWAVPIPVKTMLIYSLIHADGFIHVPAESTGLAAGEWVTVFMH
ncbi:MAG: molybdopterin molybdotransferase MoeA [Anaerolineae bacterium]|nr:molybdopterin molybdotransferase MoeA [Anaerolineae bacterium]